MEWIYLHIEGYLVPVLIMVYYAWVIFAVIKILLENKNPLKTHSYLLLLVLLPIAGLVIYLFFGQDYRRHKFFSRKKAIDSSIVESIVNDQLNLAYQHELIGNEQVMSKSNIIKLLLRNNNAFLTKNNKVEMLINGEHKFDLLLKDLDKAKHHIHLEYYIFEEDEIGNIIIDKLIQKSTEGVMVRFIYDSVGSSISASTINRLKKTGVISAPIMPVYLRKFSKANYRDHRKIVVIDGAIAYTGSQNMVDPDVFKKDAGVGNWIDLMVKINGPVVESLAGTFISDWFLETNIGQFRSESLLQDFDTVRSIGDIHPCPETGVSAVQLVPSGPGFSPEAIHSLLLTTIYASRNELIMTTPYFIPDEPLLAALKAAAWRGVDVKIIVPKNNDSLLVQYASRARYEELAEAGVKIYLFDGGLLHSKTITVDRDFSLFGSVNLDMRSFWLNFEATLFIYCPQFTNKLCAIQKGYLNQSKELNTKEFAERKWAEKFKENVVLLIAPLL